MSRRPTLSSEQQQFIVDAAYAAIIRAQDDYRLDESLQTDARKRFDLAVGMLRKMGMDPSDLTLEG